MIFCGSTVGSKLGGSKIPWRFPIRIIITEFYLTLMVLTQKVGQNTIPYSTAKNLLNQSANGEGQLFIQKHIY